MMKPKPKVRGTIGRTEDREEPEVSAKKKEENLIVEKSKSRTNMKCDEALASTSKSVIQEQRKRMMQSRLHHEVHPLSNDLIKKKIFGYFSLNDLKNYRLVCKTWRDQSLTIWKEKAVLQAQNLFDGQKMKEFIVSRASKLQENPLHRYNVDSLNASLSPENRRTVLDFFSSTIQHLDIYCDDLDILLAVLTKLPELNTVKLYLHVEKLFRHYESIVSGRRKSPFQGLNLTTSKVYKVDLQLVSYYTGNYHSFPWEKIFESVPATKVLGFHYGNWAMRTHLILLEKVMHSLCEVRKQTNFSTLNLEELDMVDARDLFYYFPVRAVTSIVECNLPLQRLFIDLGEIVDLSTFWNLLEAHAKTLQYLRCDMRPNINEPTRDVVNVPSPLNLPSKVELKKLKDLVFGSGCLWAFHFLNSLDVPNLESLRIVSTELKNLDNVEQVDIQKNFPESETFLRDAVFPKLKTFFYEGPRNFSETEMQQLAKLMPNVTDVTISLGDKTFPLVFELWPGLHSLNIISTSKTYSQVNDSVITGIPAAEGFVREVPDEIRQPNITNLRNLEKFSLQTRSDGAKLDRPEGAWITNVSAVHGFLLLPKLQFLELETICRFSEDVQGAMRDHVRGIQIKEPEIFKEIPRVEVIIIRRSQRIHSQAQARM